MSTASLVYKQVKSEVQNFRRNPTAAIFTIVFPLIFLSLGSLSNNKPATFEHRTIHYVDLLIPGVIAFGIFTASFTNLAMRITILRDLGVLRRVRGTPVPTWIYLAGHIGTSVLISFAMTAVLAIGGAVIYSVQIPTHMIVQVLAAIALGAFAFCAMALAISGFIPNADAAAPIVQLFSLPQFILGGIFFPITGSGPFWAFVRTLPLYHLSHTLKICFNLPSSSSHLVTKDLIALAAWGTGLTIIALRNFKWENKVGVRRRNPRRKRQEAAQERSIVTAV
jgi:ABC-2 type transport system permease protein